MSKVALVPVNSENLKSVLALKLTPEQESFLPDVKSSIELGKKYPDACFSAITKDGTVVGYSLYGIDQETNKWKIFRLMVGAEYQGCGVGTRALELLINKIRVDHQGQEILTTYYEGNHAAKKLFKNFDFIAYGKREDRILAKLSFV